MQTMLEKVVTDGTATNAKLDGYRAAGKTGTAQKSDGHGYSATKLVASFAGFAPASNPVISMVVVVDEPVGGHMGGEIAAPIFKNIANRVLQYKRIAPDIQDYTPPRYTVAPAKRESGPASSSKPAPTEEMKVIAAKFTSSSAEKPQPGDITVPDFRGMTLTEIYDECRRLGLESTSDGSGRAVQQNPPAGTVVRHGAVVDVRLSIK
jgi:membrane carboxypeptidase/penicillin-binding protein